MIHLAHFTYALSTPETGLLTCVGDVGVISTRSTQSVRIWTTVSDETVSFNKHTILSAKHMIIQLKTDVH